MKSQLVSLRFDLQEKLVRVILITGFFALVAVSIEELQNGGTFRVLAIYLPSFFAVILLYSFKIIPPHIKSIILLTILTLLGFSELYFFGIKSMAFVFLLAAVTLAALMNSTLFGVIILFFSLAFTIVAIRLFNHRLTLLPLEQQSSSELIVYWISPVLNFLMLSVSCLIIIHIVINTLVQALEKKEAVSEKLRDETQALLEANLGLEKMAFTDPVTNLPNNSKYLKDLSYIILSDDWENRSIYLILIELVDFADFNIKYGIEAGNELLRNMGQRLKKLSDCQLYRETGARFLIQGLNKEDMTRAQRNNLINNFITEPFTLQGDLVQINYKAAEINYPGDIPSLNQMFSTLIMTLKDSDRQPVNSIIPYSKPNILEIQRRTRMKELLKNALVRGEIYTHIQPRLDMSTGLISGGELLIRWNNPELGMISPDEFIPTAEKEMLIFDLTLFVLDGLDSIIKEDFSENIVVKPTFSINISPVLFHSNQMYLLISRLEEKRHWANIEFELTEGVLIGNSESILESIRHMQNKKIGISIDDFGTGYSNIEYLQDLEADIIKIDKRFISGITHNEKQRNIVKAIINIAKALNLHIVAEGVEYREQYEWLKEQGVQEIQGFLLSKAMGFNEFSLFVKAHRTQDWI